MTVRPLWGVGGEAMNLRPAEVGATPASVGLSRDIAIAVARCGQHSMGTWEWSNVNWSTSRKKLLFGTSHGAINRAIQISSLYSRLQALSSQRGKEALLSSQADQKTPSPSYE